MRYRLIPGVAAVAIIALALVGCSSGTTSGGSTGASTPSVSACKPAHSSVTTIKPGVLTVSQYPYPPFSIYADGELSGVEGDVLTEIAKMECLKIEVVPGEAAAMITNVQTGRADTTLGSWYRTSARAAVVDLSAPIVTSPLALISKNGASTVNAMSKLTIGAGNGLVAVADLQKLLGGNLKTYADTEAEMSDLQAGRIQGVVLGLGAAVEALRAHPISGAKIKVITPDPRIASTVTAGQTNFPTNKSATALGKAIDADIAKIRSSGLLKKIAKKYNYPIEAITPGAPNLL